ncbi:sensor histidine kinase [Jeotgalibaca caeni]|uniref:sensor histidine kinase n=1 Tax=Jeotgalibaca caeni TaxID=3028623 RepID=UPI00237E39F2|nr:HAMP domain-containing sensor histidine kinase [Jeotgalibaca caeni]MDE1547706.1 HAMP domain-containing sensor histidine kinase [Jeotgalibaca caeni]
MKYLYKHLLAFFCVILFTVFSTGMIFVRLVIDNVYQEKETQLFGYAESVIDGNMTIQEIEAGIKMISHQDVLLALYDDEDQLVYPVEDTRYSSGLTPEDLNQLAKGERLSLSYRDRGFMNEDMSIVTVYLPLFHTVTGEFSGFVAVASPVSGIQNDINYTQKHILLTVLISGGIASLISIGFANYLSRRIVRMRNAAKEITEGNFDISLDDYGKDEFDELSHDFNLMARSLKASEVEIERQENLRRQFMMDVAHEMRTPLTTINGILEGLAHDMIPEKSRQRSIELMHKETKRMIRMVNENLDYEKIRSEQVTLVKQEFLAIDALTTVHEQLRQKAASKGNEIVVQVEEQVKVYADYDRFIQIIVNLANNAIQFTDNGSIRLEAKEEEGYTWIQVSDTGIGIAEEELNSIWERFYKVDISRKNNKFGESGIGLAIVKSLVDNHGGTISVHSEPGKGTVFTIRLPNKEKE